ncbi:MAG TPA: biotin carboxyl carrier domain-containing protein [Paracoccus sp.]|nr:biotin carboxyl carrier domain-containing protein [Paracoccus sp. (in: a-proteobacteria)]
MSDILSPLPGTFYHAPSPESDPFKKPGDPVAETDTIGLVEVMKTFIEVKAEVSGVFDGFVADNAGPIQAGDVLAKVR